MGKPLPFEERADALLPKTHVSKSTGLGRTVLSRTHRGLMVLVLIGALLSPLLGGCNSLFAPASEVTGMRVLAIRAEPPTLSLGGRTTLDALAITPDDTPLSLRWELCAYTLSDDELRACGPGALLASAEGDTFDIVYSEEMATALAPLCDREGALAGQIPDGASLPFCSEFGVMVTARLIATAEDGEELIATSTIMMRNQSAGPGDSNPQVLSVEGAPQSVTPGEELTLECVIDPASIDTFKVPDEDEPREETLSYRWYVAGGSLASGKSGGGPLGGDDDTPPEQARVVADDEAEQLTVWVVVEDERDGVAWARVDVPVAR